MLNAGGARRPAPALGVGHADASALPARPHAQPAPLSSPDAYVYLAESIRAWPDQQGLAGRIEAAGWGQVEWSNLTGGIVALHRGRRPA